MNFSTDLDIAGIYDAGIPNLERVVLRANNQVDLSWYCLVIALRNEVYTGGVPITDNFFWLGNTRAERGDWVFIYTAAGKADVYPLPNSTERVISLFWGKHQTVFQAPHLTAGLLKVGNVQYPNDTPRVGYGEQIAGQPKLMDFL